MDELPYPCTLPTTLPCTLQDAQTEKHYTEQLTASDSDLALQTQDVQTQSEIPPIRM